MKHRKVEKKIRKGTAWILSLAVLFTIPALPARGDETGETVMEEAVLLPCQDGAVTLATDTDAVLFTTDLDAPLTGNATFIPDPQEDPIYGAASLPSVFPSGITSTNVDPVLNLFPPVRNQGSEGVCWAYAAAASAELYGVKTGQTDQNVDYSETALAYSLNHLVEDPLGNLDGGNILLNAASSYYMQAGANSGMAMELFYQWLGPVQESLVPSTSQLIYGTRGIPEKTLRTDAAHITSFQKVSLSGDRDYLKKLIKDGSSVACAGYYSLTRFYDNDHASYCSTGYYSTNHAITLVGWNDAFSYKDFVETPLDENGNPANGAWLVRNSWGDNGLGKDGYFWLSYYDPSLLYSKTTGGTSENVAYVATYDYDDAWDYNYQYDGSAVSARLRISSDTVSAAAVYTVSGFSINPADVNEKLTAVTCEVGSADTAYKVEIYRNPVEGNPASGELVSAASTSGRFPAAGAYTIPLASPVELTNGETFSVVITLSDAAGGYPYFMMEISDTSRFSGGQSREYRAELEQGQNYFTLGSKTWYDLVNLKDMNESYSDCGNLRIKALTEGAGGTISSEKVTRVVMTQPQQSTVCSGSSLQLSAAAYPASAANRSLTWSSSNTAALSVSAGGVATAKTVEHATRVTVTAAAADGSGAKSTVTLTVIPVTAVAGMAHVQTYGWQNSSQGLFGTTGKAKRLEAIALQVFGNDRLGITYTTHCQTYGWLDWSRDGDMNGTQGEAKRLEALEMKLTGADAEYYDVYYRVHVQHFGWLAWAKNGEPAGSAGYSYRMEALQILVVPRWMRPAAAVDGITSVSTVAYYSKNGVPGVSYTTHVQTYGWQSAQKDGAMSGTEGLAKRLEGIRISLIGADRPGGIRYRTHVQTYGWQSWRSSGAMSGTSGESKRLEAIEITLTGDMASAYDIYYRVHSQHYGWMGWAKNGESAGTAGFGYRLEGIQILLIPKGGAAPSDSLGGKVKMTSASYISR